MHATVTVLLLAESAGALSSAFVKGGPQDSIHIKWSFLLLPSDDAFLLFR